MKAWTLWLALPLLLSASAEDEQASWMERIRFNAGERTRTGIERLEDGDTDAGARSLETAWRLDPARPLTAYNAGTAQLLNRDPHAVETLSSAAESAPPELAPAASFNLGNALLAGGDPARAIESYKKTLRAVPDHQAAKFNLELALRRLEEQRSQPPEEQQGEPSDSGEEDDSESESRPTEPQDREDPQADPADQQDERPSEAPSAEGDEEPEASEQTLPEFEDQPEMTAEEAAALLQAVEDLERQQRREAAAERASGEATVEKDW